MFENHAESGTRVSRCIPGFPGQLRPPCTPKDLKWLWSIWAHVRSCKRSPSENGYCDHKLVKDGPALYSSVQDRLWQFGMVIAHLYTPAQLQQTAPPMQKQLSKQKALQRCAKNGSHDFWEPCLPTANELKEHTTNVNIQYVLPGCLYTKPGGQGLPLESCCLS